MARIRGRFLSKTIFYRMISGRGGGGNTKSQQFGAKYLYTKQCYGQGFYFQHIIRIICIKYNVQTSESSPLVTDKRNE